MNKQQLFKTLYEPFVINGYKWQYVGDGWLDVTSGLVWLEEEKKQYTYNEASSLFSTENKRLPTVEEYIEAEKHRIRNVIKLNRQYWTSSIYPNDSSFAYYFNNDGKIYNYGVCFNYKSVCCVREYE